MDKKTLQALKASIRHWEKNVAAETPRDACTGPDSCALCALFWHRDSKTSCVGCPVFSASGYRFCYGSPYDRAELLYEDWKYDSENHEVRGEWREAAQAELDFLKSLLPEGEG